MNHKCVPRRRAKSTVGGKAQQQRRGHGITERMYSDGGEEQQNGQRNGVVPDTSALPSSTLHPSSSSSSPSSASSSSSVSELSSSTTLNIDHRRHSQQEDKQHDLGNIFSELHFHRQDPRPIASLYLRIFQDLHAQGRISRKRALWMLRSWGALSYLAEADVTWRVAAGVAKAMGITSTEIEGEDMLVLGPTLQEKRRRARIGTEKIMRDSEALKNTERFRALDQGELGKACKYKRIDCG